MTAGKNIFPCIEDEKGRNIVKMKTKKLISLILCVMISASLIACGKQNTDSAKTSDKEFAYVPEYISMSSEEEGTWYSNYRVEGNTLYYDVDVYEEDGDSMTYTKILREYSLADGSVKETQLPIPEKGNASAYALDADGNIYMLIDDYSAGKTNEEGFAIPDMFLNKYDAQQNIVFEKDITDVIVKLGEEYVYVQNMLLDEQGNVYVCLESTILLLNSDGEEQGAVEVSGGWINTSGLGKDGKVYVSYYDQNSGDGGMVFSDIDFAGKKLGGTYRNVPGMNGRMSVGIQKDFLLQDGSKIYEYDLESQSYEELCSWLDCDINGNYVECIGAMEDGTLVAVVNDWDTNETELVKLVKTAASEVVQKKEIVIGVLDANQELQAAAVAFNKANDSYRVTIKAYMDYNNWTENSYNEAITGLNNDITSDSNCPDILELSSLNGQQLASKGVLEDLAPYLEKSTVFSKEDFLDGLLDRFTYDDKLITIPSSFNLSTVVGKTSLVGEKMGWSLTEMIEFARKYPNAQLFDAITQSTMLQYCMMFNQDSFIDWSKGECHFDSEGFKALLEFVAMFPEEIDWENYSGGAKVEERQTDQILLDIVSVHDFQEIQMYPVMYGEDVTFIGFPTTDGSVGCAMTAGTQFAIASKSENKDGAWAFIESYLQSSSDGRYTWGFSTLKESFEAKVEEVTRVEYLLDENGEQILDENGEPIVEGGSSSIGWEDWEYTYHTPTEEDIALIRELISVAKPISGSLGNDEILNIITEEAEGYLKGQKSIDEVVGIIQSRAQIYISENS